MGLPVFTYKPNHEVKVLKEYGILVLGKLAALAENRPELELPVTWVRPAVKEAWGGGCCWSPGSMLAIASRCWALNSAAMLLYVLLSITAWTC